MAQPKAATPDRDGSMLYDLIADVGEGRMNMQQAGAALRNYVSLMPAEERDQFKKGAVDLGRRLMQIAEGFQQELTVIASGIVDIN